MISVPEQHGDGINGEDDTRFALIDVDGNCLMFFPDLEISFLMNAGGCETIWLARVKPDRLMYFIGQHMRVDPLALVEWIDAVTEYAPGFWPSQLRMEGPTS